MYKTMGERMKTCISITFLLLIFQSDLPASGQVSTNAPALLSGAVAANLSETEKINHLIDYIGHLEGSVFIRNGKEYAPAIAADHLEKKYNKHKKKVRTALEFIDRIATFSKTKEPYQIRFSNGHLIPCGQLLKTELLRIENQ